MELFLNIFIKVIVSAVLFMVGYYLWEEYDGFIGLCLMFSLGVFFMMKAFGF